jgi:hypothetical protein
MTASPAPPPAGAPDLHTNMTDVDIAGLYHASQGQTLREQDADGVRKMAHALEAFLVSQSVSVPESARHMLEETANKLVTYTSIYTGDKQARRLINELRELATNIIAPAALLSQSKDDTDPIGELQAEARQEKLDEFVAAAKPQADADERAKACVAACASIPTYQLYDVGGAPLDLGAQIDFLREKAGLATPHQGEGSIDSEEFAHLLDEYYIASTDYTREVFSDAYKAIVKHVNEWHSASLSYQPSIQRAAKVHPLAGQHINQGSFDAAADQYEGEYLTEKSKERIGKMIADIGVLRVGPEGGALILNASAFKKVCTIFARTTAPVDEDLHFNAQRLRNVAVLVGLASAVPDDDATLDGARGSVLGQIAAKLRNTIATGECEPGQ